MELAHQVGWQINLFNTFFFFKKKTKIENNLDMVLRIYYFICAHRFVYTRCCRPLNIVRVVEIDSSLFTCKKCKTRT